MGRHKCCLCGMSTLRFSGSREEATKNFWIQCDACRNFFHGGCVEVEEYEVPLINEFRCPTCAVSHGKSTLHPFYAPHRLRYYDIKEQQKKMEIGSRSWIEQFVKHEGRIEKASGSDVTVCEDGHEFIRQFTRDVDWKKIYLVRDKRGLEMKTPPEGVFSTQTLVDIFGTHHVVDLVDVYRQTTTCMRLGTFHAKYSAEKSSCIYNILSPEFGTNTKIRSMIIPPRFVREMSLVNKMWPDPKDTNQADIDDLDVFRVPQEARDKRPNVDLFCLCGMAGSFTNFHIDFGGSSVWFHLYEGEKVFYIAPPTPSNLRAYENNQAQGKSTEFFGDKLEGLKRVEVSKGNTLMMPSGWIHAVYTPKNSIAFSGNFLHEQNIPMQLKVYQIETNIKELTGTDEKFLFPEFELINQHVSLHIEELLKDSIEERRIPSNLVVCAANALLNSFKAWETRHAGSKVGLGYPLSDFIKKLDRLLEKAKRIGKKQSGRGTTNKRGSTETEGDDNNQQLIATPAKRQANQSLNSVGNPPMASNNGEKLEVASSSALHTYNKTIAPNSEVGTSSTTDNLPKPAVLRRSARLLRKREMCMDTNDFAENSLFREKKGNPEVKQDKNTSASTISGNFETMSMSMNEC